MFLVLLLLEMLSGSVRVTDAQTGDPYAQIAAANAAFEDGRFDEALGGYESAVEALGDSQALDYNRAAAKYKLGDYPGAAELFARAAMSPDPDLSRQSRFAWGNCDYASALATLQPADAEAGQPPDLQGGGEKLDSAIRHYRDALATGETPPADHPTNRAARENIERSQRLIEAIKEALEQQQQQDQQQNQEQDQEQKQDQQQDQEGQEQDQPQDEQQQSDGQQDQAEQQQDQQQSGEQQDEQNQEEQQQQAGQQQSDEQQDQQQQTAQEQQEQQMQEREMSPEEVEALLQAARDKEQKRRQEKLRRMRARRVPVTKDW